MGEGPVLVEVLGRISGATRVQFSVSGWRLRAARMHKPTDTSELHRVLLAPHFPSAESGAWLIPALKVVTTLEVTPKEASVIHHGSAHCPQCCQTASPHMPTQP